MSSYAEKLKALDESEHEAYRAKEQTHEALDQAWAACQAARNTYRAAFEAFTQADQAWMAAWIALYGLEGET